MEVEKPALRAAQDRVTRLLATLAKAKARAVASEALAKRAEARAQEAEARAVASEARAVASIAAASENLPARSIARLIANSLPYHANRNDNARVICLLLCLEEGPLSIKQLRGLLGIAQASASDWVSEAAQRGVLKVVPSKVDKRTHLVQLTPKGRVWARDRRVPLPVPPAPEDEPEDEPDADV